MGLQELNINSKVKASHLSRDAYLYVRQSTMHQVQENTESTKRQYQLRERALGLGWQTEQIRIIDCDQAKSGASTAGREGFQQMVAEVSLGKVGMVMGLEVSRLARNNADWHRLLELCSFSDTLILDQDGLYDPSSFNDRLVLNIKGTLSEAELHILKSRMQQGILNKAKRGELKVPLPAGFEYDELDKVILCRDMHVQESFRRFFATFKRLKSAMAIVKEFHRDGITFPHYCRTGSKSSNIVWGHMTHSQALRVLRNPRYAGAFAFGRTRTKKDIEGKRRYKKAADKDLIALVRDVHEGYISWDEFEANRQTLSKNSVAYRRKGGPLPPREGPALLQGLAICGKCGKTMTVRYHQRKGVLIPDYICQRDRIEHATSKDCQHISGKKIEEAISKLVLEMVNKSDIKAAVAVREEMKKRLKESDRLRRSQVERCRYEADLARRRYMQTDPDKRYVTEVLEAEWNEKLRKLEDAQKEYEKAVQKDREMLNDNDLDSLQDKLSDFSKIWKDKSLGNRDRKRIVRLLIEDVTILKGDPITMHIRLKGGASKIINVQKPEYHLEYFRTAPKVITLIDQLLDHHIESEIAEILNQKGLKTGMGHSFKKETIYGLRARYKIPTRSSRLRKKGLLTRNEIYAILGCSQQKLNLLIEKGVIKRERYGTLTCLFEKPSEEVVKEIKGKKQKKTNNNNNHN
jgi:DNA invertase Pin-like site-specific DNA recombinase